MDNKTAIVVGRFQAPYLHLGHIYLISYALQHYEKTVIFLGCATEKDDRNPYSIAERMTNIKRIFPQVEIQILWDAPDDASWSRMVDLTSQMYRQPILVHSRDSFYDRYNGYLSTHFIPPLEGYSGTKLREELIT